MAEGYRYSVDVDVDVNLVLTETQKNQLMIGMSDVLDRVLGTALSGVVLIHSERKENTMPES